MGTWRPRKTEEITMELEASKIKGKCVYYIYIYIHITKHNYDLLLSICDFIKTHFQADWFFYPLKLGFHDDDVCVDHSWDHIYKISLLFSIFVSFVSYFLWSAWYLTTPNFWEKWQAHPFFLVSHWLRKNWVVLPVLPV